MRDLNPKVAADGQGTFCCKCPFLQLLISFAFHTVLMLITLNKKSRLKKESIYPFCMFKENPSIIMKLG